MPVGWWQKAKVFECYFNTADFRIGEWLDDRLGEYQILPDLLPWTGKDRGLELWHRQLCRLDHIFFRRIFLRCVRCGFRQLFWLINVKKLPVYRHFVPLADKADLFISQKKEAWYIWNRIVAFTELWLVQCKTSIRISAGKRHIPEWEAQNFLIRSHK